MKAAVLYDKQTINLQNTINIYGAATMGHCNTETTSKVAPAPENDSRIICLIHTGYTPNDIYILDGFEQLESKQYGPTDTSWKTIWREGATCLDVSCILHTPEASR